MPELDLSCVLSWPGGSLEVENEAGGYGLETQSFTEMTTAWRRHEVQNQWVEGAFTVGAVKENQELPLNVYVTGNTPAQLQARVTALTDVLDRLAFTVAFTEGGVTTTWRCQVSDYIINRSQSLRVARHALVSARVPAFPTAVVAA